MNYRMLAKQMTPELREAWDKMDSALQNEAVNRADHSDGVSTDGHIPDDQKLRTLSHYVKELGLCGV